MKAAPGVAFNNRYRLVRQIAVGGMGEVWVARDESLARDIAVKVLKPEFVGNPDFLARFRTEARNAASLSHANIAQLYDYGEQGGSAYLVMELVGGEPMSDLLEREPVLPAARLLSILAQTARALHAAHVGGVVHRDIKPGNILLEHTGEVKITDFGVSLAANQIPMTAAGMVMEQPSICRQSRLLAGQRPGHRIFMLWGLLPTKQLQGTVHSRGRPRLILRSRMSMRRCPHFRRMCTQIW